MLELRPNCECCNKDLPPDAADAVICTFECTFCRVCVQERLGGVCPNCGGNFVERPIRPAEALQQYPVHNPAHSPRILRPQKPAVHVRSLPWRQILDGLESLLLVAQHQCRYRGAETTKPAHQPRRQIRSEWPVSSSHASVHRPLSRIAASSSSSFSKCANNERSAQP